MLSLSRKVGESIVIDGNVFVTITEIKGNRVRLSFDAPRRVTIDRKEIHDLKNMEPTPEFQHG